MTYSKFKQKLDLEFKDNLITYKCNRGINQEK